jgi:hypothetical protein
LCWPIQHYRKGNYDQSIQLYELLLSRALEVRVLPAR